MLKHIKKDDGFSLIELIVVMVVLALLVLGTTFTYQAISKMNNISAKKDFANQLSSSFLDQLSEYNYSDISSTSVETLFTYPSYIDASGMNVTGYSKNADGSIRFTLNNLQGKLSEFFVDFEIVPLDYELNYNMVEFPLIQFMSNENTFVVNDKVDTTVWSVTAEGEYEQANDLTHKYIENMDSDNSYDYQAVISFQTKNQSKLLKRYEAWESMPENNGIAYDDSPFKALELTVNDIYNAIDKETELVVENSSSGIHKIVTVTATYKLNLNYIHSLGGFFATVGSLEDLFDGETSVSYEISSRRFFELSNVYILYWGTSCKTDTYTIENESAIPLNMYFIIENEYNAKEIINGHFSDFSQVDPPLNLKGFYYNQNSPQIDLSDVYTNSRLSSVIHSSVLVDGVHTCLNDMTQDLSVRLYDVNIIVHDKTGNLLLNRNERNVLGK